MDRLVVSVHIEEEWGEDTSLWETIFLGAPPTPLAFEIHIEPPVWQQI